MGNQATPVIDAVQDFTLEKVILSGSPFVSAILGPGSYVITAPFTPLFHRDPIISGPFVLGEAVAPPLLTCEAQSFSSSPRATIAYQWKRDGVDIGAATSITYVTVLADIGTTTTCEVTITNPSGSDIGLSNGIAITAPVPSLVGELDVMTIGGMSDPYQAIVSTGEISIIAGLPHYMKIDVNEADLYLTMGMPNDVKIDINEFDAYALTGVTNDIKIDLIEAFIFPITGSAIDNGIAVEEANAYAMHTFLPLGAIALINGDAEAADMTAWTMDIGNVTAVTSAPGHAINYGRTGQFFKADERGLGLDSQMSQVVVLDAGFLTDVDLGRVFANPTFNFYAERHYDGIQITLEALNAADGVLATQVGPLHYYPNVGSVYKAGWFRISADGPHLSLPTLTRKIKITVLFQMSDTTGTDNNGYIDNIVVDLLKLE